MYDLAIIGAGPAGATLARLLGDSYTVLLIDRRRFSGPADDASSGKCCGGLLAPDAQRMISRFGLGLPKHVLVEPQLFVVRAIDIPRRLERYYQRYYINMDRAAFDRWLVSLIPPSVDVRTGCRFKSYESGRDGFRLDLLDNGSPVTETARILVGADGASSRVRQQTDGSQPAGPAYLAVQEWVEADGSQPHFSAIFDPQITDYYCWTIPKGDRLLIGAALPPRRETARRFETLREKLTSFGFRLGPTLRREAAFLRRPRRMRQLSPGGRGIALLGEAGGWISPSSAEGLSYAMRTALALAEALQAGPDGFERRYRRQTRSLARNIFLKNLKSRLIFNPALRGLAMRSGLQSMEITSPSLPRQARRQPR
jgi:geranylgeranyl diphosphate/geranylgeranyl-bacteriochlorophyllide a reductase